MCGATTPAAVLASAAPVAWFPASADFAVAVAAVLSGAAPAAVLALAGPVAAFPASAGAVGAINALAAALAARFASAEPTATFAVGADAACASWALAVAASVIDGAGFGTLAIVAVLCDADVSPAAVAAGGLAPEFAASADDAGAPEPATDED